MSPKNYPSEPLELNESNFDETIRNYSLVIVDFWAPWCAPCIAMEPVIKSLAKKYVGRIVFGKLHVDENRMIASKYGIMSIPTLLVFKEGKLIDRIIGAMPESLLESRIKSYL